MANWRRRPGLRRDVVAVMPRAKPSSFSYRTSSDMASNQDLVSGEPARSELHGA